MSGRMGQRARRHEFGGASEAGASSGGLLAGFGPRSRSPQAVRDLDGLEGRARASANDHPHARSAPRRSSDAPDWTETPLDRDAGAHVTAEFEIPAAEAAREPDGPCAALMRCFFEESRQAILLFDSRGAIVDANPAACRVLGRRRESLEETPLSSLVGPGHLVTEWRRFVAQGRGSGELAIERPDGTLRHLRFDVIFDVVPWVSVLMLRA